MTHVNRHRWMTQAEARSVDRPQPSEGRFARGEALNLTVHLSPPRLHGYGDGQLSPAVTRHRD
jgi:hypothetical protein